MRVRPIRDSGLPVKYRHSHPCLHWDLRSGIHMTGRLHRRSVPNLYYIPYTATMTAPIPTRFNDDELRILDDLVERGVAPTRSAVIRRAVAVLSEAVDRARTGAIIAEAYRDDPQSDDEVAWALANAVALVEAESW